jgi:hypothetical protein
VFLAALFDLLYSAVKEDYIYCILFVLVGFLVAFFNKNMTVILTLTIATSTILRNLMRGTGVNVEGLETNTDEDEDEDDVVLTASKSGDSSASKSGDSSASKQKPTPTTSSAPKLMESLKEQALTLKDTQKEIIDGFQKIEPYMNKAESLIGSIQETALDLKKMRDQSSS